MVPDFSASTLAAFAEGNAFFLSKYLQKNGLTSIARTCDGHNVASRRIREEGHEHLKIIGMIATGPHKNHALPELQFQDIFPRGMEKAFDGGITLSWRPRNLSGLIKLQALAFIHASNIAHRVSYESIYTGSSDAFHDDFLV